MLIHGIEIEIGEYIKFKNIPTSKQGIGKIIDIFRDTKGEITIKIEWLKAIGGKIAPYDTRYYNEYVVYELIKTDGSELLIDVL